MRGRVVELEFKPVLFLTKILPFGYNEKGTLWVSHTNVIILISFFFIYPGLSLGSYLLALSSFKNHTPNVQASELSGFTSPYFLHCLEVIAHGLQ